MACASARKRARISPRLRRQQVACIHRQQLPELHRRSTQLRELIGNAAGVGRRQQQVGDSRTLALGELPRALRQHAAGNATGRACPA
jgi:hypothetical protein